MSDSHEDHEHEKSSIEEAGGVAVGVTGTFENFNSDAEARLADALMKVGRYVQGESGCLLGHIKAAVYTEDGKGITLNLIDMDNGVEHHGTMAPTEHVKFNFMCAVLDVDEHELQHIMIDAVEESGIEYQLDPTSMHHHHHHHGPNGEVIEDDDDDDHECHCHDDHDGDDKHHEHHHDNDHECHCKACEDRRKEEAAEKEKQDKPSFRQKHFGKKKE